MHAVAMPSRLIHRGIRHSITVLALGAAIASAAATPPSTPALPDALERLSAKSATVFELRQAEPDRFGLRHVEVATPLGGFTLDLRVHSVRAEGFQLLSQDAKGRFVAMTPPPVTTVRGTVDGVPGARVVGSYRDGRLQCLVKLPDGIAIGIEPQADAGGPSHIAYLTSDLIPGAGRCGHDDDDHAPHGAGSSEGGIAGGTNGMCDVQVAVDCDSTYFQSFGSGGVLACAAQVESIINTTSNQYETEAGIRNLLTAIVVRTSTATDPYGNLTAPQLNFLLASLWAPGNFPLVERDLVHLFNNRPTTPHSAGGVLIGLAYRWMCFGDTSAPNPGGTAFNSCWPVVAGAFAKQTDLVAHETGHNWLCDHCTCANPASTMNDRITGANTFANSPSVGELTAWFNAHNTCIDCSQTEVSGCGDQRAGSPWQAATTPYSSNASCCALVCVEDSYCCETAWDEACRLRAIYNCTRCGETNAGDPFAAHATPGCSDILCCQAVCGFDAFCCDNAWDSLCVQEARAECIPSNDECSGAWQLVPYFGTASLTATTMQATGSTGGCGATLAYRDVWFKYEAATICPFTVSTCGAADFNTVLRVYRSTDGSCSSLVSVACNDDSPGCAGSTSTLTVTPVFGSVYYIQLAGRAAATGGIATVTLTQPYSCHPNEECATALVVGPGLHAWNTAGSSTGTPCVPQDVWFAYDATASGPCTVSSGSGAVISIRTGSCSAAPFVQCLDTGTSPGAPSTTFTATCGERYYISVGLFAYNPSGASGQLSIAQLGTCRPGDLNGDSAVNGADLAIMLSRWGLGGTGDLDGDGTIGAADLAVLLGNWG